MQEFSLIETMRSEDGIVALLRYHMERLAHSAEYFSIPAAVTSIAHEIADRAAHLHGIQKLRLLVAQDGSYAITDSPVDPLPEKLIVGISNDVIDQDNVFFQHKTTNRELYNSARKKAVAEGMYDLLFTNQANEITEGSITTVYVKINDMLYTPPVSAGLLPGVYRQFLLESGKASEKKLFLKDLMDNPDAIFISNALISLCQTQIAQIGDVVDKLDKH